MPEDPKQPDPPKDPAEQAAEQAEEAYWNKLEARLDSWFDKKVEKYRTTSPSRTGRTTLPGVLANVVFGPEKKD